MYTETRPAQDCSTPPISLFVDPFDQGPARRPSTLTLACSLMPAARDDGTRQRRRAPARLERARTATAGVGHPVHAAGAGGAVGLLRPGPGRPGQVLGLRQDHGASAPRALCGCRCGVRVRRCRRATVGLVRGPRGVVGVAARGLNFTACAWPGRRRAGRAGLLPDRPPPGCGQVQRGGARRGPGARTRASVRLARPSFALSAPCPLAVPTCSAGWGTPPT